MSLFTQNQGYFLGYLKFCILDSKNVNYVHIQEQEKTTAKAFFHPENTFVSAISFSGRGGHMHTYGRFMLIYGEIHHSIVK